MKKIVIAIDGPAGAGKTTIAKELSKKLNIPFFSTGAMYRALALKCLQQNLDPTNEDNAKIIAENTDLKMNYCNYEQHIILDGKDVSNLLYDDKVSEAASKISTHKEIRSKLVEIQQQTANTQSVIMDGRDIGSVVLPNANFKFYLDADVDVRAKRRYDELIKKGQKISYEEVLEDMKERDYRDKTREISPLKLCDDAIVIDCTNLNITEVLNKFIEHIGEQN